MSEPNKKDGVYTSEIPGRKTAKNPDAIHGIKIDASEPLPTSFVLGKGHPAPHG